MSLTGRNKKRMVEEAGEEGLLLERGARSFSMFCEAEWQKSNGEGFSSGQWEKEKNGGRRSIRMGLNGMLWFNRNGLSIKREICLCHHHRALQEGWGCNRHRHRHRHHHHHHHHHHHRHLISFLIKRWSQTRNDLTYPDAISRLEFKTMIMMTTHQP